MNLTDVELKTVEALAELFYNPMQIALILDVDDDDFNSAICAKSGSIYEHYTRGYYKGDLTLRKSISESAQQGSSPAQTMLLEIQKQCKISQ
ncbi:MAG: hypothetical protein RSA53_10505 [Odoribacter sp.]